MNRRRTALGGALCITFFLFLWVFEGPARVIFYALSYAAGVLTGLHQHDQIKDWVHRTLRRF